MCVGSTHALALGVAGEVLQLGAPRRGPAPPDAVWRVPLPTKARRVYAWRDSSYAVDVSGRLWAWGNNSQGQLGLGGRRGGVSEWVHKPTLVAGPAAVVDLLGFNREDGLLALLLVLEADGSLWICGTPGFPLAGRALGLDDAALQRLQLPFRVQRLAAPGSTAIVQSTDGLWWLLEHPGTGQLLSAVRAPQPVPMGLPDDTVHVAAFSTGVAGTRCALALDRQGGLWEWTRPAAGPSGVRRLPLATGAAVRAVALDGEAKYAIDEHGGLWAWGTLSMPALDPQRQAGTPPEDVYVLETPARVPNMPPVRSICLGDSMAYAVGQDGSVWGWGFCAMPSSPTGDWWQEPRRLDSPCLLAHVLCSSAACAGIDVDGGLWTWGHSPLGFAQDAADTLPVPLPTPAGFVLATAGVSHARDDLARLWDAPLGPPPIAKPTSPTRRPRFL